MKKKMKTIVLHRDYLGIMEKKMETTITVDEGHLALRRKPPCPNNVILRCTYTKLSMMRVNRDPRKTSIDWIAVRKLDDVVLRKGSYSLHFDLLAT